MSADSHIYNAQFLMNKKGHVQCVGNITRCHDLDFNDGDFYMSKELVKAVLGDGKIWFMDNNAHTYVVHTLNPGLTHPHALASVLASAFMELL